jgi:hypothetical protein
MENKKSVGCVGRTVFLLWVFLFGLIGGVWFGFNLARLYPDIAIPQAIRLGKINISLPVVKNPFYKIVTPDGIDIQISNIVRQGEKISAFLTLKNNGQTNACISYDKFQMKDNRERIFVTDLNMESLWCDNPGFSGSVTITGRVPPGVSAGFYYIGGAEPVFMASVPD